MTDYISELNQLGWNNFFENQRTQNQDVIVARIVGESRGQYQIAINPTKIIDAKNAGALMHAAKSRWDLPSIGDWVEVQLDINAEQGSIKQILTRKTCMFRKSLGSDGDVQIMASNIDCVFIVTSLNEDFNLRRLERYLALAWDSGAQPIVLLTKSDLVENISEYTMQVESIAKGVDIHALSALNGSNIEVLRSYFKSGITSVLVGSSGVGKSTLVNSILGTDILRTQEVSKKDDKGKHTTTFRELFFLPNNQGMIIDTPGVREVGLWLNEEGLSASFEDVESLFLKCKFTDCKHETEPGCAVKNALNTSSLDIKRWENYLKLRKEISYLERKSNKGLQSVERTKWKKIHKDMKAHKKSKT